MSLKRWSCAVVLSLPLFSLLSLTGCGDAPANAPPAAEKTPEELKAYEEEMRKTGGRG